MSSTERRLRACVEAWPEAEAMGYDPRCCRFPKSCSPYPYQEAIDAGNVTDADLEPTAPDLASYKGHKGLVSWACDNWEDDPA